MFTQAGQVKVKIEDVKFATAKFAQGPSDFDICIMVSNIDDPAQVDWWRGEISADYGKGNFASMTQAEIAMKTLHNIGFEGGDLSTLKDQLVGKETTAMIKAVPSKKDESKIFYNIQYLGSGSGGNEPKPEEELDVADVKNRISALFGGAADVAEKPAPAPKPAPKAEPKKETPKPAAPAGNPFGNAKNPFAKTK